MHVLSSINKNQEPTSKNQPVELSTDSNCFGSIINVQIAIQKQTHAEQWVLSLVGDDFDPLPFIELFEKAGIRVKLDVRSVRPSRLDRRTERQAKRRHNPLRQYQLTGKAGIDPR